MSYTSSYVVIRPLFVLLLICFSKVHFPGVNPSNTFEFSEFLKMANETNQISVTEGIELDELGKRSYEKTVKRDMIQKNLCHSRSLYNFSEPQLAQYIILLL